MVEKDEERDWTYKLARLAGVVGFNETRVRWKLIRVQRAFQKGATTVERRAEWARYEHQNCPVCGALQDKDERQCVRCRAALPGRTGQVLKRVGLWAQLGGLSPSMLLAMLMIAIYARMVIAEGTHSILAFSPETLEYFGGNVPGLVLVAGEWWRLATSILLHAGIWHIGFNVLALMIVGPAVEQVYGRGRMVLFFLATGLLASAASALAREGGVGIGASGAIMGLIGVACGWGHRQKTPGGRELRNQMLKWCAYTVGFGFLIGADNVAHVAGFLAGGAIGLVPFDRRHPTRLRPLGQVLDGVAVLGVIATAVLCFYPPLVNDAPLTLQLDDIEEELTGGGDAESELYERWGRACDLHREQRAGDARDLLEPGETIERVCDQITDLRTTCEAFRERGPDALPNADRLRPETLRELAENYDRWCTAVGRPPAPAPAP